MEYNSLQQIRSDFNLHHDDLALLRDELNRIRISLHPDKNNGQFPNTVDETRFHQANEAIIYIERLQNNHSLAAIERMTDLVKVVKDLPPVRQSDTGQQRVDRKSDLTFQQYRSHHFFPKITFTVMSAILTFLIAFPGSIKNNPTLAKLINPQSPSFAEIWLLLVGSTGLFWILVYLREERAKKILSQLKLESTQYSLFINFLRKDSSLQFYKDELTTYIYNRYNKRKPLFSIFFTEVVSQELAQEISTLILNRSCENNFLIRLDVAALDDFYELSEEGISIELQ
jgi:hypothetical protein